MRFDPVRMIEACYAPVAADPEWLEALLEAAAPLDLGMGVGAATFVLDGGRLRHETILARGILRESVDRLKHWWEREASPDVVRAVFPPNLPVAVVSEIARRTPEVLVSPLRPVSFRQPGSGGLAMDSLALLAIDSEGRGTFVTTPSTTQIRVAARTRHQLAQVSAHLLSARRLRAHLSCVPGPGGDGVEAVLDPDGRVQHADAEAKEARARSTLAMAVRRVERARGRLRRTDPEEALALWEGLVDGRWSLVDHCEADGRRFVLARRNDPGVRDPSALAPRERDVLAFSLLGHSNKYVGYLLGIAPSTVASHLASAMAKLRVRSRRELMAAMGTRAPRETAGSDVG